jgi:cyclophilin family peptidyl-prolyl cis-trans isomerase
MKRSSQEKRCRWERRHHAALLLIFSLAAASFVPGCASNKGASKAELPPFSGPDPIEVIDAYIAEHPVAARDSAEGASWKTRVPRAPTAVVFDPSKNYDWYLHTSAGVIKIRLKPEWAPRHVASTIYLARLGFYDGLDFHRIIPKFMAQGGDPLGTGVGGPGYRYAGEFHRKARHSKRGVVSMANSGPRTDGSQFFILFDAADQLDGRHTVFGQVVEGMGTLKDLEMYGSEKGEPRRRVVIESSVIQVN